VLAGVCSNLGRTLPRYGVEQIVDTDWVRQTQAQFSPIAISKRLWVVPSWCEPVDPHAINLRLDPGLAFGTGSHPTTRLCLDWLEANLRPRESVLDYGCGSGILAIAAARLGGVDVHGVDVDPQAIEASRVNAALNGVDATFATSADLRPRRFDVVVANILANPLVLLAPLLAGRVVAGGSVVLSGILEDQTEAVCSAYEPWFNIGTCATSDGWVALAGRRDDGDG
jgi:ribosomal protein L11 methyltransferase